MTRKEYILLAKALATIAIPSERRHATAVISEALSKDNPRFKLRTFVEAVEKAVAE